MYKGGPNYTPQSAKIIQYASLAAPVILVVYGLSIQAGAIHSTQYLNDASFFALSFWWLVLGVIQFLYPSRAKHDSTVRLIAYHLAVGGYLLFVSGVATPIAAFWLLLLLVSNASFSRKGLGLSILGFVAVVAVDIVFWHNIGATIVAYDLMTLVVILLSGLVTLSLSLSQKMDHAELSKSKQQASLQRDRVLTIVNNLSDAVLSTDMDGVIRVYNAASMSLLDTNDSLNGRYIDDLLPLVDQSKTPVSLFGQFKTAKGAFTRDDLNYIYDDGEAIRLEITYSPIRSSYSRSKKSETHDGYIVIMRDITKAKSLEEERDEFISVVSHELRTPITIVEGTISNVQIMMKHPDATQLMLTDAITMAHDQIVYLAHMVNDLSTLSRAERGVSDAPEDIDVRELIHKLHDEYNKEATGKGLHLNLDIGGSLGHVYTSRLYLEEILQNLITNAIKYTKTGSVTIEVKQKLGLIDFAVKDTGIGISKSDQAKIFQKFYRSEDYRTRETSGTGLGLYVTLKLAHKAGTKIEFTSRLNHGSKFSFSLPVKAV